MPLLDAARLGWMHLVGTPDGIAGLTTGRVGVTAGFPGEDSWDAGNPGNAGGRERGFDDQGLFADFVWSVLAQKSFASNEIAGLSGVGAIGSGFAYGALVADQVGRDSHPSLAAHRHAVQSQDDSVLLQGQYAALVYAVVNEHATFQTNIGEGGAAVD